MGSLNLLEGPHSLVREPQEEDKAFILLPASSPPRPAEPRTLGSEEEGWSECKLQWSEGAALSGPFLRAAEAFGSHGCPGLLLPSLETLL